jgi:hypothetical protein
MNVDIWFLDPCTRRNRLLFGTPRMIPRMFRGISTSSDPEELPEAAYFTLSVAGNKRGVVRTSVLLGFVVG